LDEVKNLRLKLISLKVSLQDAYILTKTLSIFSKNYNVELSWLPTYDFSSGLGKSCYTLAVEDKNKCTVHFDTFCISEKSF